MTGNAFDGTAFDLLHAEIMSHAKCTLKTSRLHPSNALVAYCSRTEHICGAMCALGREHVIVHELYVNNGDGSGVLSWYNALAVDL